MAKSKILIAALLLFLALWLPAGAQLEDLFKQAGGTPAAEGKEIPDLRGQLGKWKAEAERALEGLDTLSGRLNVWEFVVRNELASVAADIVTQQSRACLLPADDLKLAPLNRQSEILWEKQALVQRAHQSILKEPAPIAVFSNFADKRTETPGKA